MVRLARPKPEAGSTVNISIRASRAWREWLRREAENERISLASLIDRAVMVYAQVMSAAEPPPKR